MRVSFRYRHRGPFLFAVPLLGFCSAVCAAPTDSFLPVPVPTVDALVEQVQSNEAARRAYAHLFHLPPERVAGFLRTRAVSTRLVPGGRYTRYYVHPGGTVYPALVDLAPGSRVFSLPNGFVLAPDTGNPARPYRIAVETAPASTITQVLPPRQTIVPLKVRQIVVPSATTVAPVYQTPPP